MSVNRNTAFSVAKVTVLQQGTLSAPAKINLYLEILGRRDDGFHALETIFQSIDLADQLSVYAVDAVASAAHEKAEEARTQIRYSNSDADYGSNDICYRAVEAVRLLYPALPQIWVQIEKHIPVGGGLGGASSDAAAILRTLAEWYDLDAAAILQIALALGSDVPFFIQAATLHAGTMYASGRGEVLQALPDFQVPASGSGYLLLLPDGQETAAVFKALSAGERGPRPARGFVFWHALAAQGSLHTELANRLSAVTQRLHPGLARLMASAESQGIVIHMSGSGSTCFSFDPRAVGLAADAAVQVIPFACSAG